MTDFILGNGDCPNDPVRQIEKHILHCLPSNWRLSQIFFPIPLEKQIARRQGEGGTLTTSKDIVTDLEFLLRRIYLPLTQLCRESEVILDDVHLQLDIYPNSLDNINQENYMAVITLMTDFGIKDGNVGVMKGVVWGICPSAQISDLSHMIGAQNIREAALVLLRSVPYFPKGTVHVVVIDPGVGTGRRPMAARIGDWYYVGPDNGTITLLLERAEQEGWSCEFVQLDKLKYWLPNVSFVFHGRDIFSPVGAHLANGVPLSELGTSFTDPVRLQLPKPIQTKGGLRGEVIHIDHFGNVASNIRVENLGEAVNEKEKIVVRLDGMEIKGMVNTFGERPVGDVVALLGSTGNLIVSVVNGNAADKLGAKVGDVIEAIIP